MPHSTKDRTMRMMMGAVPCLSLVLFLFALPNVTHAADRYFVGALDQDTNSPADSWEDSENWSTTPCGSTGASVPGTSDVARFSGTCGNTVTIRSQVNVLGLELGASFTGSVLMGTGSLQLGTSGFLMGSGTFAGGGSGNLLIAGDLTMTGGIVNGLQTTTTLSGALSITEAVSTVDSSFTSTGTLILDGTDQTFTVGGGTTTTFSAVTIASSSGTTLGSDLTVGSTLTINASSNLTISTYTLFMTGASLTITNNGIIAENTGKIVHTASTFLIALSDYSEAAGFNVGNTVYFTLTDSDENIDGTAADTLTITVTTTGGDSETVTLTETGNATGIFRGSVSSSVASVATSNGVFESPSGTDSLSATYTDAQDGLNNTDDASFNVVSSTAGGTSSSGGGGGGGGGGSRRSGTIQQYGLSTGLPTARRKTSGEVIGVARMEEAPRLMEAEEETPALPWTDIRLSQPYADAALELYDAGIVKGNDDGTVRLNGFLNRVEALTLLMRTLGAEDVSTQQLPFSDVQQNAWYAPSVRAAVAIGLIKGFPDGTFRPAAELNLVQSLKLVSIALGLATQDQEERAARWFDPYVAAGRQAGLVSGILSEGRTVRRGEFFSWLTEVLRQHAAAESAP